MKYIILITILSFIFTSCSNKKEIIKHRTNEQKQAQKKAFDDLDKEIKKNK